MTYWYPLTQALYGMNLCCRCAAGSDSKEAFKIVYVANMKALCRPQLGKAFLPAKRLTLTHDSVCFAGIVVRELTGDMQLSKKELTETQVIVTTPEKWDVITRKGGDVAVAQAVTLLIIDEVHLLNDERGPVIETLVARTQRQVCFDAHKSHDNTMP